MKTSTRSATLASRFTKAKALRLSGRMARVRYIASIIAGLCRPDSGSVQVNGRIAPLLEIGSGFHPDLTGVENVMLNAALLGFTRREAMEKLEELVEFSEIGEFVNEPIRTYSSGMMVRLAFSVAVHVNPQVLHRRRGIRRRGQSLSGKVYPQNHGSASTRDHAIMRIP